MRRAVGRGGEVQVEGGIRLGLSAGAAYTYTSTQILQAPACTPAQFCDTQIFGAGEPLFRRPRHSANLLVNYLGKKWGGNLRGSFVGRRADSDFYGLGYDHAPSYVLVDLGGWYAIHPTVTAYLHIDNALDRRYNEVVGYPALPINFRTGLRFRVGGD